MLCLGKIGNSDTPAYFKFGESSGNDHYIVKHNKQGIFNFDESANYYVIKAEPTAITYAATPDPTSKY